MVWHVKAILNVKQKLANIDALAKSTYFLYDFCGRDGFDSLIRLGKKNSL